VLLEAIQLRDALLSRRLVQQWVHRRGLASLQEFQTTTLVSAAGHEARLWLEALLEPPSPGIHQPEPGLSIEEPLQQVEAAFAALAAEFAAPAPCLDPVPAPAQSSVEPPPLSFAIASATDRAAVSSTGSAVEGPPPTDGITEAEYTMQAEHTMQPEDGKQPAPRFPLPGQLPRLGRLKRLVRGCYEGAIGGFQAIRAGEELLEPFDPGDLNGISEADEAITAFDSIAADPLAADPLALSTFIDEPAAPVDPVEPVAPLPEFHAPGIAACHDGPLDQPAAADQSSAEVRRPTASLAFRLPRLGNVGPFQRPAPAPDALADLRAWLPDEGDDLPRAC
jgi:hypothetical protein